MRRKRKPRKAFVTRRQRLTAWLILLLATALAVALVWPAQALQQHYSGAAMHDWLRQMYPDGLPWGTINARKVNFREGPGKGYDVVAQWGVGTAVEVMGEQDGWYQVLHWAEPYPMWVWHEYVTMTGE